MVDTASPRSPVRVTYECASTGTRETTTATELSLGGLFIETTQKTPQVGAFVAMEIESGSTKVTLDGRVLSASAKGFSVSFIDLPNDAASGLAFILATKMPRRGTTLGLGEAEEGVAKYVSERRVPSAPKPAAPPRPAAAAPLPPAAPAAPAKIPAAAETPRHPTPRMVRAEPSTPPAPPVVPPAPISSGTALAPVAMSSRASAPPLAPSRPPAAAWGPPPGVTHEASSTNRKAIAIVIAAIVVLVLIVAAIFALQS